MRKEIRFTGMSTLPAGPDAPGGELDYCEGLVNDGGGLVPAEETAEVFDMVTPGMEAVYVHEGRMIFRNSPTGGNALWWHDGTGYQSIHQFPNGVQARSVTSIGHFLAVLATDGVQYALWKDDGYTWLGHAPEYANIRFGLTAVEKDGKRMWRSDDQKEYTAFIPVHSETEGELRKYEDYFPEEHMRGWSTLLTSQMSSFTRDIARQNLFTYNFWVRYGYRLSTGQTAFLSPPVHMLCNTGTGPRMVTAYSNEDLHFHTFPVSYVHKLQWVRESLGPGDAWKDLIKGVDIYITQPVQAYDSDLSAPERLWLVDNAGPQSWPDGIAYTLPKMTDPIAYNRSGAEDWTDCLDDLPASQPLLFPHAEGHKLGLMELRPASGLGEKEAKPGPFYLLSSVNLEDLPALHTVTDVPIDSGTLENITQMPVLKDEYRAWDIRIADTALSYNARLNIANIRYRMFGGYALSSSVPIGPNMSGFEGASAAVYMYVREDGREHVVKSPVDTLVKMDVRGQNKKIFIPGLYYPNVNAYKADIRLTHGNLKYGITVRLKESAELNGALYVNPLHEWESPAVTTADDPALLGGETHYPRRLMQSDPASVIFPAEGVQEVGQNSVLALATTARAVHDFQSGQDPLYVFTEDAVWAMSLNDDGTYLSVRPASFDPIRSGTKPVQTDDSVAFISRDGIRVMSGGQSVNVSAILDAQATFRREEVKAGANYVTGFQPEDISARFRDFLSGAFLHFDYRGKRLYAVNTQKTYGYVLSKEAKTWSLVREAWKNTLQSYPDSYLIFGQKVHALQPLDSDEDTATGLVFTRPLPLAGGALFSVAEVRAEGVFTGAEPQLTLFGTLDYEHWQLIASCAGGHLRGVRCPPFKAVRVGVRAELSRRDTLAGITIEYQPRYTARLR